MSYTGVPDLFDPEGKIKSEKLPTSVGVGEDGESAYEIAVRLGYSGNESQWIASLKGQDGTNGTDGDDGYTPIKGVDYFDGVNGRDGTDATVTKQVVEAVLTGEITSHSHASSGGLTQAQILTRQL